MSTKHREEFVSIMARHAPDVTLYDLRRLMRNATTLNRLNEAECNGDYPADGGHDRWKTKPCPRCEMNYAPASFIKGVCPSCRAQDRVTAILDGYGLGVVFNGDPRGGPFYIVTPDGFTNDMGGRGIYVPAGSEG